MSEQTENLRVFVSHSHQDNDFCRTLVAGLRANGLEVWYDEHNLGWGQLRQTIDHELERCRHFVAILSPDAVSSDWVNMEIDAALAQLRRKQLDTFVLVVARTCRIPLTLEGFKRVEGSHGEPISAKDAVSRVVRIVRDLQPTSAPSEPSTKDTHVQEFSTQPQEADRTEAGVIATVASTNKPATPAAASSAVPVPHKASPAAATPKLPRRMSVPWSGKKAGRTFGAVGALIVILLVAIVLVVLAENPRSGSRPNSANATNTPTNTPASATQVPDPFNLPTKFNPVPFHGAFLPDEGWPHTTECYTFGGEYYVSASNDSNGAVCFVPVQQTQNATVVSDIGTADGFGLVFRARDATHYYRFDIAWGYGKTFIWTFRKMNGTGSQYTIVQHTNQTPATYFQSIKVRMTGTHFEFFVNNTLLGSADDASYSFGMIGIYAGSAAQVYCTYIDVT